MNPPGYDEDLEVYYLNNPSRIINVHPNSDYWLGGKDFKRFKKDVIIWPCGDYRQKVHKGFEEVHSLSNVIGVLDGSHMNLFETPSKLNKDVYFARKRRYTIHSRNIY
ncbi:10915_t:CDS:2 [Gigaspora margarita]|uniref:10915_t:CDS:1 n=1 Tax=Gigaspora margarita TaxID=4874 RepID=A0ABN7VYX5_GIGMA|nr:10915_t:CDS:2 [Gigaspora margarita]